MRIINSGSIDGCTLKDSDIYFINGINSSEEASMLALRDISNAMKERLTEEAFNRTNFYLAYNPAEGILADVHESYEQSTGRNAVLFLRSFLGFGIENVADNFRAGEAVSNLIVESSEAGVLPEHLAQIKNSLRHGRRVIIIGYSQGNFFMNAIYQALTPSEQSSTSLMSIATPDDQVADGSRHITLTTDRLISLIDTRIEILDPNFTNTQITNGTLGHLFAFDYFSDGLDSREQILNQLTTMRIETPLMPAFFDNGVINATLTWEPINYFPKLFSGVQEVSEIDQQFELASSGAFFSPSRYDRAHGSQVNENELVRFNEGLDGEGLGHGRIDRFPLGRSDTLNSVHYAIPSCNSFEIVDDELRVDRYEFFGGIDYMDLSDSELTQIEPPIVKSNVIVDGFGSQRRFERFISLSRDQFDNLTTSFIEAFITPDFTNGEIVGIFIRERFPQSEEEITRLDRIFNEQNNN